MFSIADMAVAGAVALILFGPDQLPKVARKAGQLVRDVQNTSQSFIRELERAADDHEATAPSTSAAHDLPVPPIRSEIEPLIHHPPLPETVSAAAAESAQKAAPPRLEGPAPTDVHAN